MTLLKLLRCFQRIVIICSDYSTETFPAEHLLPRHLWLETCFTVNYFFDELDQ